MTRQAFPSILLSVAIVGFFAVALYRRDPHPPPVVGVAARPETRAHAEQVALRSTREPARRPSPKATAPAPDRPDPAGRIRPVASRTEPRRVAPAVERGPHVSPSSRAPRPAANASRPQGRRPARPALTVARSGETIADVARRVYGRDVGAEGLWRANREVIRDPRAAIPEGTILNTPAPPSP